ncbi:hypothetical protein PIB30_050773 [Stylosanthes scabra]|uniref:Uncharacterized protein n=1 Tax=Stylosanthes scabra TaxID=79078 RepID=A0ABU6WHP2_9FABA|nr:hypothetical protein [Stylosanthes scabra]
MLNVSELLGYLVSELHRRSKRGAPGGPPERILRRSTSAEYKRSILAQSAMLLKCLDFRSIELLDFGLRICPEQCPKLVKLACWVCEFPQQDLSPECPKPSRELLGIEKDIGKAKEGIKSKKVTRGSQEVRNRALCGPTVSSCDLTSPWERFRMYSANTRVTARSHCASRSQSCTFC